MYLSRIEINPRRRESRRALAEPRIIHAAIEAGFPDVTSEHKRNLWRIDKLGEHTYFLVLSREKPDFTHIIEQFGWPKTEQTWETKEYGTFLNRLDEGQQWHFRLCGNPVHSVKTEGTARGKVYGHVTVEQQRQWFFARAQKNGFAVSDDEFDLIERSVQKFRREKKYVTLSTAVFEGNLTVTDKVLLAAALKNGIGRAKAYGCGLLTLAKTK